MQRYSSILKVTKLKIYTTKFIHERINIQTAKLYKLVLVVPVQRVVFYKSKINLVVKFFAS